MAEPVVNLEVVKKLHERYQCPIWIDREGNLYPMSIMSPRHMQNAWRQYKREIRHAELAYSTIYDLPEDGMAFYYAEQESEYWYSETRPKLAATVRLLEHWMRKRNIPIPEDY